MNDEVIDDLKQFITATVTQSTADLAITVGQMAGDLHSLKSDVSSLKSDVSSLKISVDEINLKVDTIADALTERLDDHEHRITKLETQTN